MELIYFAALVVFVESAAIDSAHLKENGNYQYYSPTPDHELLGEDKGFWFAVGGDHLQRVLNYERQKKTQVAKNVVILIGDGMGLSTVTATRIYRGQRDFGKRGEEHSLTYDEFPNVGLVKTYNVDMQVPDSAGTATALFTGVKTRYEAIGVDVRCNKTYFDKALYESSKTESIMTWAQHANKDTGIITTTRVTHATPAATYAHVNHRKWECDSRVPAFARAQMKDISRQLIEDAPGRDFKVVLGGGHQQLGHVFADEGGECLRADGRNLTQAWVDRHRGRRAVFATNSEQLAAADGDTEYLLGLFAASDMPYELVRDRGPRGPPSLSEMTAKGLQVLQRGPNGFVLMVEGGRIDHGHHANYARLALGEAAEFDKTVALVMRETGPDTLVIVTADHSHVMTLNGYGRRGNDILGYGVQTANGARKPALTLTYANGPGFVDHFAPNNVSSKVYPWADPRYDQRRLHDPYYRHMAPLYLADETHGGEDVAIWAAGPGSHLVRGVMEQNYIAHLISYVGCFGPRATMNPDCGSAAAASALPAGRDPLLAVCVVALLLFGALHSV